MNEGRCLESWLIDDLMHNEHKEGCIEWRIGDCLKIGMGGWD